MTGAFTVTFVTVELQIECMMAFLNKSFDVSYLPHQHPAWDWIASDPARSRLAVLDQRVALKLYRTEAF